MSSLKRSKVDQSTSIAEIVEEKDACFISMQAAGTGPVAEMIYDEIPSMNMPKEIIALVLQLAGIFCAGHGRFLFHIGTVFANKTFSATVYDHLTRKGLFSTHRRQKAFHSSGIFTFDGLRILSGYQRGDAKQNEDPSYMEIIDPQNLGLNRFCTPIALFPFSYFRPDAIINGMVLDTSHHFKASISYKGDLQNGKMHGNGECALSGDDIYLVWEKRFPVAFSITRARLAGSFLEGQFHQGTILCLEKAGDEEVADFETRIVISAPGSVCDGTFYRDGKVGRHYHNPLQFYQFACVNNNSDDDEELDEDGEEADDLSDWVTRCNGGAAPPAGNRCPYCGLDFVAFRKESNQILSDLSDTW